MHLSVQFGSFIPRISFVTRGTFGGTGSDLFVCAKKDVPSWVLSPTTTMTMKIDAGPMSINWAELMPLFKDNVTSVCLACPWEWTPQVLQQILDTDDKVESLELNCAPWGVDSASRRKRGCRTLLAFPNLKSLIVRAFLYEVDEIESTLEKVVQESSWPSPVWLERLSSIAEQPPLQGLHSPLLGEGLDAKTTKLHYQLIKKPTLIELTNVLESTAFCHPLHTIYTYKDIIDVTWSYL